MTTRKILALLLLSTALSGYSQNKGKGTTQPETDVTTHRHFLHKAVLL
jgi:hypothetical protein